MTSWRPQPSPLRFVLLLAVLICALFAAWVWSNLVARTAVTDLDPALFLLGLLFALLLFLLGMLAYVTWCAFTVRYAMDQDTLTTRYGGVRYDVPLSTVRGVHAPGDAVELKSVVVRWRGVPPYLPGFVVGMGQSQQLGRVLSVATAPVHEQVFVVTPGLTFGISPASAGEFVTEIERRRKSALPAEPAHVTTVRLSGISGWAADLWLDTPARRLMLAGLVLNLLFFGYMSLVYGDLPSRLALHWNSLAQVDRVGDPLELLRLPVFALAVWLANVVLAWWALRRERAVSLFLLGGAVAAQIVFWAGALSIILRAP